MLNRRIHNRPAFSLMELLVVLAIIAVATSLLIVAAYKVRGTADRLAGTNNLRAIGLAMHNYHLTHKHFPTENGDNPSFYRALLPYVEANATDTTPINEYVWPGRRTIHEVGAKRDFGYAASKAYDSHGTSILDTQGAGASIHDISRGTMSTYLLTTVWMDPRDYIRGDARDGGWAQKQNSRMYGESAKPDSDASGTQEHLGSPYSSYLPILYADSHVGSVSYLTYTGQWSYHLTTDTPARTPKSRMVVRITVPDNSFRVEIVPETSAANRRGN